MLPPFLSLAFAIALALTPAAVAWWTGRKVLARADDPVFPELLFERGRRLAHFAIAGGLGLAFLFIEHVLWALPLLWLALLLTSYPLRRRLFGERLSALAFLRYAIFSGIGQAGLWLLAGVAPAVVTSLALGLAPNDHHAAVKIALWGGPAAAAIVALWQYHYTRVFLDLHRATPLRASARPELMARFDAILDRVAPALARRPGVYRFGAPGAYIMNAVAIPSRAHPAVALGDTLLATLSDDELVAVFAHEIAHHEQFNTPKWRRGRWRTALIVLLIGALPALIVQSVSAGAIVISWCMPLLLIAALGKRPASNRDAETASDVRAATLTGNVDAMVSALTKLHVYSHVPRRWPHAIEHAATHPSLARRIQALREATQAIEHPEAEVAAPLTAVRSRPTGFVVAFDRERAYWFDGVPAETPLDLHELRDAATSYRAISYSDLTELRVGIADADRSIDATDRDGRNWKVPIAPNDVATVQSALDRVDVKLGRRRPALAAAGASSLRWLTLVLFIALTGAGQSGFTLIPILVVLFRPTLTAAVAAMATIAVARLLVASRMLFWADTLHQIALLIALAVAVVLIVQTVRRVRMDTAKGNVRRLTREAWAVAGVLVAAAALMGATVWPMVVARPGALITHPVAIGVATLLFGAGAALLTTPSRWWRAGGVFTSVTALVGGVLLSSDGLLQRTAAPLKWTTGRLSATGAARIPGAAVSILASPNGKAFAVMQYATPRRGQPAGTVHYVIGRFDDSSQARRTSTATKLAFVDDETLLALDTAGVDSLEVRAERIAAAGGRVDVPWRERIPFVEGAILMIDRERRSWVVLGRGDGDYSFVVVTDSLGGTAPRIKRFAERSAQDVGEGVVQHLAAFADGGAIWLTMADFHGSPATLMPVLFMAGRPRWELRGTDGSGERLLADLEGFPSCAMELDAAGTLCVERSSNALRVLRARSAKLVERIADLPPTLDLVHAESSDRVTAAERFGQRVVVFDAEGGRAVRLTLPQAPSSLNGRWTADAAARGAYLLVLTVSGDAATLTRYVIR